MAFSKVNSKGDTYYLHVNKRKTKTGKEVSLFYFSREVNAAKALDAVPDGYELIEMKTGLPALKKKA